MKPEDDSIFFHEEEKNSFSEFTKRYIEDSSVAAPDNPDRIKAFGSIFKKASRSEHSATISHIPDNMEPSKNVVFAVLMQDVVLLTAFLKALTNRELQLDESSVQAEHQFPLISAAHTPVRADMYVQDVEGNVYTVDMQRTYTRGEQRLLKRSWYYAARDFSAQNVHGMMYEELNSTLVSFVLPLNKGHFNKRVVHSCVCLEEEDGTFNPVTNMINVYEVFAAKKSVQDDLQIFIDFFAIKDDTSLAEFSSKYKDIPLANRLLANYAIALSKDCLEQLRQIEREEHFMKKTAEEILAEERLKGIAEGELKGIAEGELKGKVEVVNNLLKGNIPLKVALKYANLDKADYDKYNLDL